jgi:hypothetical protein
LWARRRKIQLPYHNTFESIWEYKKAFLSRRIDVLSAIGPCPICGKTGCYREITPYERHAIELFPKFKKELIPVSRAVCRTSGKTFSLLPIQLLPYHQYTADAVLQTLLLGLGCREAGQTGFWGAYCQVDPESLLTPWLVSCWLSMVLRGFQRAHKVLRGFYLLDHIRIVDGTCPWDIVACYCQAFFPETRDPPFQQLLSRYAQATSSFLFGIPSQERIASTRSVLYPPCTPGQALP